MATTTSYGTFGNAVRGGALGVEHMIVEGLGDYGNEFDIDAIAADYRAAVNDLLEGTGVSLCGDEFIGPHRPTAEEDAAMVALIARADLDSDRATVVEAAVKLADEEFWDIANKHQH